MATLLVGVAGTWIVVRLGGPRQAIDEILQNVERVERMGRLQVRGVGEWDDVPRAAETRLVWSTDDAFLEDEVFWRALAPGFDLGSLELRRAPNPQVVSLVIARLDPDSWDFRVLAGSDFPSMGIEEMARAGGAPFALNGPFFDDRGPLGLVVVDGAWRSDDIEVWTSHFLVDDDEVRITFDPVATGEPIEQGFQGFPAIMKAGEAFRYMRWGGRGFDVWALDRRTAACIDRQGRVLFLVTRTLANGVSFHELTTVLGGLGCTDAMGFDGGTSSGLYLRVGGVEEIVPNLKPVPVALAAYPK